MPSQMLSVTLLVTALIAAQSLYGQENSQEMAPPWLQQDVLTAAYNIQMSEPQRAEFRRCLSTFVHDLNTSISKLALRDEPDLDRAVRRKRDQHIKRMDVDMAKVLTAEQLPRYHAYRDLLVRRLSLEVPSDSLDNVHGPRAHGQ